MKHAMSTIGGAPRWAALALVGVVASAGCSGKSAESAAAKPTGAVAADAAAPVVDERPLPGVNVTLTGVSRRSFFKLVDAMPSPCGKPHSLRVSLETDPACRRSPHAVKMIETLLTTGEAEAEIASAYRLRYEQKPIPLDVAGAAMTGAAGAKVWIAEFFDYGCSHCKELAPTIAKLKAFYGDQIRVHYMNFPLGHWPDSEPAARAAWAASRQGAEKFSALYQALFAAQEDQRAERVLALAQEVGLDMTKFLADWKSPAATAQVAAERDRGVAAGVKLTPTVIINGKMYTDRHLEFDYMKLWVDEELDVTR